MQRAARKSLEAFPEIPQLSRNELWYWQVYQELQFERPSSGMGGLLPIPRMSMINYGLYLELPKFEIDLMVRIVRQIDFIMVAEANKKNNNK